MDRHSRPAAPALPHYPRPVPRRVALLAALLAAAWSAVAPARAEAFSFLATPTDQLAVPGLVAGTEITPDGSLYTGHAELVLAAGAPGRSLDTPERSLEGGRWPVISWRRREGGVQYRVRALSAPIGSRALNLVEVELRGLSARPARARLAVGVRHAGGGFKASGVPRFRFPRPVEPERVGLYTQPGSAFDPGARYAFRGRSVARDGRTLYSFPRPPRGLRLARELRPSGASTARADESRTLDGRSLRSGRAANAPEPSTLFGQATYSGRLRRGEQRRLVFRMPVVPPETGSAEDRTLQSASFDRARRDVVRRARRLLRGAVRLDLPEKKSEDTFYASLLNMALIRYRGPGGEWVQPVNKLQYHSFFLRDAAIITQAYDLVGLHRLARENLAFFGSWQRPDGLFISREGQYDGFGQALWALGQHARRSGDRRFAEKAFTSVSRAMEWLRAARAADGLGLMPPGDPRDNELVAGHLAGDNFWAVAGVEEAVAMALQAGRGAEAARWSAELAGLRAAVERATASAAAANGGTIPPALDTPGGQDWGNLWAAYPTQVLSPTDPRVSATLARARRRFREGIATYLDGRVLHHYLGFRVLQTELLRGEQGRVVRGLHDALAHTTGTHSGWELGIRPYRGRSVDDNLAPHGWWAAEYVALVRTMLVREEGQGLVLGSALPTGWLRPGRRVGVSGAPTLHGRVDFTLRGRRGGADLSWRTPARVPVRLVVPAGARTVRAPGLSGDRTSVRLRGRRGTIRLRWRLSGPFDSHARAVRRLRAAYERRGRAIPR